MELNEVSPHARGPTPYRFTGDVGAAVAALGDTGGVSNPGRQLEAYQALAARWRSAPHGERAALAQVLTDSPFGQKVHSVLNAFTRAAWAGDSTEPPAPQHQILKAFDALTDTDQQIVAAMQVDASTGSAFASATDYRARLQSDLQASQILAAARRPDTVTLSSEAQAALAGEAPPQAAEPRDNAPARPEVAAAIAAYSKRA